MLQELIESRARPVRRRRGSVVSVAVHAAAVALAAAATGRAHAPPAADRAPDLVFVPARPPDAPAPRSAAGAGRPGPGAAGRPAAARAPAPALALPEVDAAGALPDAALRGAPRSLVDADEFTRGFTRGGLGADGAAAGHAGAESLPPGASAVDEPAAALPGNRPPRYPEPLRAAGVSGRVVARFVVDTAGRVERGTVQLAADHPLLGAAVRDALAGMRFRPARAGGVRVRQLVELPFAFAAAGAPGAPGPR
jgi:protein TonB